LLGINLNGGTSGEFGSDEDLGAHIFRDAAS
jgi:hypothetical protein